MHGMYVSTCILICLCTCFGQVHMVMSACVCTHIYGQMCMTYVLSVHVHACYVHVYQYACI